MSCFGRDGGRVGGRGGRTGVNRDAGQEDLFTGRYRDVIDLAAIGLQDFGNADAEVKRNAEKIITWFDLVLHPVAGRAAGKGGGCGGGGARGQGGRWHVERGTGDQRVTAQTVGLHQFDGAEIKADGQAQQRIRAGDGDGHPSGRWLTNGWSNGG